MYTPSKEGGGEGPSAALFGLSAIGRAEFLGAPVYREFRMSATGDNGASLDRWPNPIVFSGLRGQCSRRNLSLLPRTFGEYLFSSIVVVDGVDLALV